MPNSLLSEKLGHGEVLSVYMNGNKLGARGYSVPDRCHSIQKMFKWWKINHCYLYILKTISRLPSHFCNRYVKIMKNSLKITTLTKNKIFNKTNSAALIKLDKLVKIINLVRGFSICGAKKRDFN